MDVSAVREVTGDAGYVARAHGTARGQAPLRVSVLPGGHQQRQQPQEAHPASSWRTPRVRLLVLHERLREVCDVERSPGDVRL